VALSDELEEMDFLDVCDELLQCERFVVDGKAAD